MTEIAGDKESSMPDAVYWTGLAIVVIPSVIVVLLYVRAWARGEFGNDW